LNSLERNGELPDHDAFKAPPVSIGHEANQLWTFLLATEDSDVYVRSLLYSSHKQTFTRLADQNVLLLGIASSVFTCSVQFRVLYKYSSIRNIRSNARRKAIHEGHFSSLTW
jgi:hypothetical protein